MRVFVLTLLVAGCHGAPAKRPVVVDLEAPLAMPLPASPTKSAVRAHVGERELGTKETSPTVSAAPTRGPTEADPALDPFRSDSVDDNAEGDLITDAALTMPPRDPEP